MGSGLQETKYHLSGVTLLECLITLTIVAILMCIGVPAYRDQLASARAQAGAQQLYAAMQYAQRGSVTWVRDNAVPGDRPV